MPRDADAAAGVTIPVSSHLYTSLCREMHRPYPARSFSSSAVLARALRSALMQALTEHRQEPRR